MNTTKNKQLNRVLGNTRGRFFGLTTKHGEAINARLVGVSPCYVRVLDNNTGYERKFAKTSIARASVASLTYVA